MKKHPAVIEGDKNEIEKIHAKGGSKHDLDKKHRPDE